METLRYSNLHFADEADKIQWIFEQPFDVRLNQQTGDGWGRRNRLK
jgi:hypothetical protein